MSDRRRPPPSVRLGSALAQAVLARRAADADDLARRLLAKEAAGRRQRE